MNEPGPATSDEARAAHPVFVSFSSTNRKKALDLCVALEARGTQCWISCRDVAPGENYQESIVRAIQGARAMMLVFSKAANSSDEIKKELSLASRHRIPVIAVRIENVQPTDAFAYELSTRQWVDAFSGRDKAIDAIVSSLDQARGQPSSQASRLVASGRAIAIAAFVAVLLFAGIAGWSWLKPGGAPAQALQVRLAGFQRLSSDLPATMPDTMRDELIAAFGDDGIVRASITTAPSSGKAPAYVLAGTIRRDGDKVRVIARLTNERSGTTVWTNDYVLAAAQIDRIPRRFAIDTSMVVRCGLFGASTYRGLLAEVTLADYFQACQNFGGEPDKALDFARKVVAAAPDFSWGWSAVEIAAFNAILQRPPEGRATELRREALRAADRAVQLDRTNSEAYAFKSHLIDQGNLVGREKLLQQSVQARTLPCGCEHHFYADFLVEVGRLNEAVAEYRRAIDILALDADTQSSLARVYFSIGRPDLGKERLNAAFELDRDPQFASQVRAALAPISGDYADGLKIVNDPEYGAPPPVRPALSAAFAALLSKSPDSKSRAVAALEATPPATRGGTYATLLAALEANRAALDAIVAAVVDGRRTGVRSWLFTPPMVGVLRDPAFPAVAERLGLIGYWRATHTKPDACHVRNAPPFCNMI